MSEFEKHVRQMSPMEICRSALRTVGVPENIVKRLKPGYETDLWVWQTVLSKPRRGWQEAETIISELMKNPDPREKKEKP